MAAIIACVVGLLSIQAIIINDTFKLRNEQFKLQAEQALVALNEELFDSYNCFEIHADLSLPPNSGLHIISGGSSQDTIQNLYIPSKDGSSDLQPYPNNELRFSEPVRARLQLQFSFLGSEDVKGTDVDTTTLDWVDQVYTNTLRDKISNQRIVDTLRLRQISLAHFKSSANESNLGIEIVSLIDSQRIYVSNEAAIVRADPSEKFAFQLYEGTHEVKPYTVTVALAGALSKTNENILLTIIGFVALTLLIALFLGQFIALILKQKSIAESKNDFVNNMTHEFKTPVTNIRLAVETYQRRLNGEANANEDLVQTILYENNRIDRNINRILNTARLEEEVELILSSYSPRGVIEPVLLEFENHLPTGITMETGIENTNSSLHVDLDQVQAVLRTILENALKYSDDQIKISVFGAEKPPFYEIRVCDRGVGMSADELKRCFDKFYRATRKRQHNVKGFGLGLYFSKTTIERHGGRINAKSKLGNGSEFTIELPLVKAFEENSNR